MRNGAETKVESKINQLGYQVRKQKQVLRQDLTELSTKLNAVLSLLQDNTAGAASSVPSGSGEMTNCSALRADAPVYEPPCPPMSSLSTGSYACLMLPTYLPAVPLPGDLTPASVEVDFIETEDERNLEALATGCERREPPPPRGNDFDPVASDEEDDEVIVLNQPLHGHLKHDEILSNAKHGKFATSLLPSSSTEHTEIVAAGPLAVVDGVATTADEDECDDENKWADLFDSSDPSHPETCARCCEAVAQVKLHWAAFADTGGGFCGDCACHVRPQCFTQSSRSKPKSAYCVYLELCENSIMETRMASLSVSFESLGEDMREAAERKTLRPIWEEQVRDTAAAIRQQWLELPEEQKRWREVRAEVLRRQ